MGINNIDGEDEEGGDVAFFLLLAFIILFLIITIGTIGYRIFGELSWIDSFHNGSMVLTSTSLVTRVQTYTGKIFSSFYNILSGIFILIILGVVVRKALSDADISNPSKN